MTAADLKDWKVLVSAAALLVAGGGGGTVFANGKVSRAEVKVMIAEAPPLIVLQQDVEHLAEKVDEHQEANEKKLDAILEAVKK